MCALYCIFGSFHHCQFVCHFGTLFSLICFVVVVTCTCILHTNASSFTWYMNMFTAAVRGWYSWNKASLDTMYQFIFVYKPKARIFRVGNRLVSTLATAKVHWPNFPCAILSRTTAYTYVVLVCAIAAMETLLFRTIVNFLLPVLSYYKIWMASWFLISVNHFVSR